MVAGGLKGDEHSNTLMTAVDKTHPEEFRGRGGSGGGSVGNDGFPPKREGGVSGDRAC